MNKLEIGAGESRLGPEWKTSDIRGGCDYQVAAWEIHYLEGLDYWDNLYACMVLEHVPRKLQLMTLQSWYAALKPCGILEVIVPNMAHIGHLLTGKNEEGIRLAYGDQDYPENTHVWGFFDYSLCRELEAVGFTVLEVRDLPNLYVKVTK